MDILGRNDRYVRCQGMLHVVEKGDTLYKIAKKHGVPLSRILFANPYVDVYNLQVGDEVCVPIVRPRSDAPEAVQSRDGVAVRRVDAPMPGQFQEHAAVRHVDAPEDGLPQEGGSARREDGGLPYADLAKPDMDGSWTRGAMSGVFEEKTGGGF